LAAAAIVVAAGAAVETDAAAALLRAELTGATVEMAAVVFVATVEAAMVPTLVPSAVVVVAIVVAASAGPDTTLGALDAAPDDVSAAAFVASAPTALVVGAAWPQAASASTATVAAPIRTMFAANTAHGTSHAPLPEYLIAHNSWPNRVVTPRVAAPSGAAQPGRCITAP